MENGNYKTFKYDKTSNSENKTLYVIILVCTNCNHKNQQRILVFNKNIRKIIFCFT